MSNKAWDKLNVLDKVLRKTCPEGPAFNGTQVTIELFTGFELFNTRPYHNYETWSSGYRVSGKGVTVEAEDLDDAINLWAERVKEKRHGG